MTETTELSEISKFQNSGTHPTSQFPGKCFFDDGYRRTIPSRLDKVKAVVRALGDPLKNLPTYFVHPITNALCVGLSRRIQASSPCVGNWETGH